MKTLKNMFLEVVLLIALPIAFSSCTNKKGDDTKDIAEEHNDAKFNDNDKEKDAQFLVNAAEINIEEISLGQLAQQTGVTPDVKELAKMMEVAHTKSLEELSVLAKNKLVTIPTSPTDDAKEAYKKLSNKSGNDLDKEYCDMMVKGHKDAITLFEKASSDATDADIKEWAMATLPSLRLHLDHALTCQQKCEKL